MEFSDSSSWKKYEYAMNFIDPTNETYIFELEKYLFIYDFNCMNLNCVWFDGENHSCFSFPIAYNTTLETSFTFEFIVEGNSNSGFYQLSIDSIYLQLSPTMESPLRLNSFVGDAESHIQFQHRQFITAAFRGHWKRLISHGEAFDIKMCNIRANTIPNSPNVQKLLKNAYFVPTKRIRSEKGKKDQTSKKQK